MRGRVWTEAPAAPSPSPFAGRCRVPAAAPTPRTPASLPALPSAPLSHFARGSNCAFPSKIGRAPLGVTRSPLGARRPDQGPAAVFSHLVRVWPAQCLKHFQATRKGWRLS